MFRKNRVTAIKVLALAMFLMALTGCSGINIPHFWEKSEDSGSLVNGSAHVGGSDSCDVIICSDNSESMWDLQEIRDEAGRAVVRLGEAGDIRIGGCYFGEGIDENEDGTSGSLSLTDNKEKAAEFLHHTDKIHEDTDISVAFKEACRLFDEQEKSVARKKIVILFSDGHNDFSVTKARKKEDADAETRQLSELLRKDPQEGGYGAEIYCVYLKREGRSDDTEFLKEITGDDSRFVSVSDSNMEELFDAFVNTFYKLQEDARSNEIALNDGEMDITVPDLGIRSLQVALHTTGTAQLKKGENTVAEPVTDGNNVYFYLENPGSGDYKLHVEGDEDAKGFYTYYSDLYADVGIVNSSGSEDIAKGQTCRVYAEFYGPDGKKVVPAEGSVIKCFLNGQEPLKMQKDTKESRWYSDEFVVSEDVISEDRNLNSAVTLEFGSFINLRFEGEPVVIENRPPSVYTVKGTQYSRTDSDGREVFAIDKNSLFYNPEPDEEVILGDVTDLNTGEKIDYSISENRMIFALPGTGDVHLSFSVTDGEGLTSAANAEIIGTVKNKDQHDRNVRICIGIMIILFLLCAAAVLWKKSEAQRNSKNRQKHIQKISDTRQNIKRGAKNAEKVYTAFSNLVKEDIKARKKLEGMIGNIRTYDGKLTDDKKEELGVTELENTTLTDLTEKEFLDLEQKKEQAEELLEAVRTCGENSLFENAEELGELKKQADRISNEEMAAKEKIESLGELKKQVGEELKFLEETYNTCIPVLNNITNLFNQEILYDLSVRTAEAFGMKLCKENDGQHIKGTYLLDDIYMFYADGRPSKNRNDQLTLKDVLGHGTGIAVYPYEQTEDGDLNEGLELVSSKEFYYRKENDTDGMKPATKVNLVRDLKYTIRVDGDNIQLKAKK